MKRTECVFIILLIIISMSYISVYAQKDTTYVISTDSSVVEPISLMNNSNLTLNKTKTFIINKWDLSEYKENGKVQELPNYEIEFFDDGTYTAIEEEEFDNGKWNLSEDNSLIIFDINTINQEEWIIESIDATRIVVKLSDGGRTYEYTFIPGVKRQQ